MWEILLPILGFLIGLVSVMVGLRGGFLVVPLLTLVYAFSPANAVRTSLATILLTTAVATIYYSRKKQTCYKTALILTVASVPGAILGSYLTAEGHGQAIGLLGGAFLVFVAWQMVYKKKNRAAVKQICKATQVFLKNNYCLKKAGSYLELFFVFLLA